MKIYPSACLVLIASLSWAQNSEELKQQAASKFMAAVENPQKVAPKPTGSRLPADQHEGNDPAKIGHSENILQAQPAKIPDTLDHVAYCRKAVEVWDPASDPVKISEMDSPQAMESLTIRIASYYTAYHLTPAVEEKLRIRELYERLVSDYRTCFDKFLSRGMSKSHAAPASIRTNSEAKTSCRTALEFWAPEMDRVKIAGMDQSQILQHLQYKMTDALVDYHSSPLEQRMEKRPLVEKLMSDCAECVAKMLDF